MPGSSIDFLAPVLPAERLLSFNATLQQTYTHAKKQLQDGVTMIREEIIDIYETAGSYLQKMALPVNNFIKDIKEIEAEFRYEAVQVADQHPASAGSATLIILHDFSGSMEENY